MDPIIGMIILWGSQRIPDGWFPCDGRQLTIQQYTPLYAIIGFTYGGDGRTYFNLPDLRSRVAVGIGQGTGLSAYKLAQQAGTETVALSIAQLPAHSHVATATPALGGSINAAASGALPASKSFGSSETPGPNLFPAKAPDYVSQGLSADNIYGASDGSTTMPVKITFNPATAPVTITGNIGVTVQPNGSGQPHSNLQPFLGMQYLIAWNGIFPNFD
jgi:microcystin-dependent protein